jgi:ribosome maturation factor RimP
VPLFIKKMNFKEAIQYCLDNAFKSNPSLFLIDFTISETNKVSVIIDGDQGVTIQDCIDISKYIDNSLGDDQFDYSLDVASAGVTSPLVFERQYIKNVGRNLKVKTINNEVFEANLTAADSEKITIEWQSREPKKIGKGKETVNNKREIVYSEIKEAIVLISF